MYFSQNRWFRLRRSVFVRRGRQRLHHSTRGSRSELYLELAPAQYCPADAMTASYDLLGTDVCPAGVDCAPFFPTVAIDSAPIAFPRNRSANCGRPRGISPHRMVD